MTAADAAGARIVLGVSGGIAAYKAAHLLRLLTEAGHDVRVVPTAAALNFVGAPTWSALSGHPVATDVWTDAHEVPHVALGRWAEVVVVAPATADVLARAAHGLADDLLANVLLTTTGPLVLAPAMHTEMWEHPATRDNVALLRRRGALVLEPGVGRLTGSDSGPGRMPEPEEIAAAVTAAWAGGTPPRDLEGRRVVVSAGGTREPLDPVRYLGNRSSGRQGHALAAAAVQRGADVVLVTTASLLAPSGAEVVQVATADELQRAMRTAAAAADAVVMAAAVADFRAADVRSVKIKKSDGEAEPPSVVLELTPDVLADLVSRRPDGQIIVGFAAETGDEVGTVLEHAQTKLRRKGCDLLVVNDVRGDRAFGAASNEVWILDPSGPARHVARTDKLVVAHAVLDEVAARLGRA
jgi:phosphopantothenoylcysteine decarboxylase/phosphopantothenate--cysteine ligase